VQIRVVPRSSPKEPAVLAEDGRAKSPVVDRGVDVLRAAAGEGRSCRQGRFAVVPDEWHAAVHERAAWLAAGTPPAMPDAERAAP
jgi:hypothetical protein